jgi:hypothetical protein
VRLEEALPLIEKARAQTTDRQPPSAELLPVEPAESFPVETIKAAVKAEKLDIKPYVFGAGDYDMGVMTPILLHRQDAGQREAVKSKEKRTKQQKPPLIPQPTSTTGQSTRGSTAPSSRCARRRSSVRRSGRLSGEAWPRPGGAVT